MSACVCVCVCDCIHKCIQEKLTAISEYSMHTRFFGINCCLLGNKRPIKLTFLYMNTGHH